MLKKVVTAVALVSAFGMVSSSAMAAKSLDSGFYVGGNLGWGTSSVTSDLLIFNQTQTCSLLDPGSSCSSSSFAWGLGAGYQFMPNFAVDFDYLRTRVFKISGGDGFDVTAYENSFVLSAKGILPVSDGFSVYGKIGPAIQDLTATSHGSGEVSGLKSVVTLYLGLGAQYNITSNFYVGVLGSYFMKRGVVGPTTTGNDVIANNYSPQMLNLTANIGYMF